MKKYLSIVAAGVLAIALVGCGDDNNNTTAAQGGASSSAAKTVKTGTLVDAPVAGVSYQCGTIQGVTDADGHFSYNEGDMCTFAIDGLTLGNVPGQNVVTPVTLANGDTTTALNIAQLLQSLDATPGDNKIEITPAGVEVVKKLVAAGADITSPDFDKVAQEVMEQNGITFVPESSAKANLEANGITVPEMGGNLPSPTGGTPSNSSSAASSMSGGPSFSNLPSPGGVYANGGGGDVIIASSSSSSAPAASSSSSSGNLPEAGNGGAVVSSSSSASDQPPAIPSF